MIKIAPSILSADFSCLDKEIKRVQKAGADMLHIDVMDGHFVPNITIGPVVVAHIRKVTSLPLDVHLMIERPQDFIKPFVEAGSDMITVHIEAISAPRIKALKRSLHSQGVRLGVSLNPDTPLRRVRGLLGVADFFLVMSVFPGFSGQKFIPGVIPKIKQLRALFGGDISVDGGVNDKTAGSLIEAGANILASGSYIFGAPDAASAMERIRNGK
ncbi:MAG TPA: ribulose-phosphate 3-epimerase [Patescibacteria group bacterium]|nr:ribulose-phosphate 3-epimerase [Patescibacteria group bacterium]